MGRERLWGNIQAAIQRLPDFDDIPSCPHGVMAGPCPVCSPGAWQALEKRLQGKEVSAVEGLYVGAPVVFVDTLGQPHPALITAIHGEAREVGRADGTKEWYVPCINVVFASGDAARTDSFGRQIERASSVVYRTSQPAHGYYFTFQGEPLNPVVARQA